MNLGRRWRCRFTLRWMLLFTAVVAMLLGLAVRIPQVGRRVHSATIAVRITSSGTVKFGDQKIPITSAVSELEAQARTFRSYGLRPLLLVESYRNTPPGAVEELLKLGKDAGFAEVSHRQLSWPDSQGRSDSP